MSEKSKAFENESQSLELNEAKNMTIGEAVRKDSEIKAGVTEDDSVLDKYIKQHRDEVSSQKFDSKFSELDTATLDNFIKKQREELSKAGLVEADTHENESPENIEVQPVVPTSDFTEKGLADISKEDVSENVPSNHKGTERDSFLVSSRQESREPKKKKKILISLLLLLLTLLAILFAYPYFNASTNHSKATTNATSQKPKASKKSASNKAKTNAKAFEQLYSSFYTDADKTTLKNSQFDKLPDLEASLKALKGTAYYDKAKDELATLKKQITAIQAVNAKFMTDAIVDGEKVEASVKTDANFDDLASETLSTGNASLDSLLQASVTAGRQQLTAKADAQRAAQEENAKQEAQANSAAPAQAPSLAPSSSPLVAYGIREFNPSSLQRQLSRVPYNQDMIADSANSAWLFNPGILEKIVATSQARDYISGNNYILEPVNIVNGNGYYNMFKPDGTYLFSINCKTGYFVGNAKGHSDALDY